MLHKKARYAYQGMLQSRHGKLKGRRMVTAIYDGYCVICQQSKRVVGALDWLHRVEFLNIHDWQMVEARYPALDYAAALGQMHVVGEDGRLLGGFEGVRRLLRELPLGFPVWLLFHLPGMDWLGVRFYQFIARNRYRINQMVGAKVCENGACKVHS
jgi:predicted DCC family thiol-disulfide oxidoreductase YuxK